MNQTIDTMLAHRSIRSYTGEPVSSKDIDQIIKAVQAAPNWVNLQHVSVIAVKDPDKRKRLSELCANQPHIAEAPVFLVFCADFYRTEIACQKNNTSIEKSLPNIDNIIVASHEVGIATATASTAAESLGLGTVIIGSIRLNPVEVIELLDLPHYVMPILGMCVGHHDKDPGQKPRLPQQAMFFDETYNRDLEGLLDEYDKTYAEYLEKRPWNNRVGNWTQLVADFYNRSYDHYPRIQEMLRRQGFGKHGSGS